MLNEKELAVLGGYFRLDATILNETLFVNSLLHKFNSEYIKDALYEYDISDKETLYNFIEFEKSKKLNLLKKLNDITVNSILNETLSSNDIIKAKEYLNLLDEFDEKEPVSFMEIDSKIKPTYSFITNDKNDNFDKFISHSGFNTGKVYVFAAPPKCGKSLMLQNLSTILSFWNDVPTLYLSLENSWQDIKRRQKLIHDNPKCEFLFEYKITLDDIERFADNYKIMIIDYAGLIHSDDEKDYLKHKKTTEALHKIAINKNCCIITAFQLNRRSFEIITTEDNIIDGVKKIQIDTIAESMGIAQFADAIFITYYDEENNRFILNNVANRDGYLNKSVVIPFGANKQNFPLLLNIKKTERI